VTGKTKLKSVVVAGLTGCGKTSMIRALIELARQKGARFAGFKPFDTGILYRNALEEQSDGGKICDTMTGEPVETLVSPYIAHETYPIEMAFRRDGINVNWGFISERLKVLNTTYEFTLIESPSDLFSPITEEKMTFQWIQERFERVIWIIHPVPEQFEHNLAEIHLLKTLDTDISLVMNNASDIRDQDLLFYIWEKIETFASQEIEGMVPFIKEEERREVEMAKKILSYLPNLVKSLISDIT
jgi:dethiobiotin synthetase